LASLRKTPFKKEKNAKNNLSEESEHDKSKSKEEELKAHDKKEEAMSYHNYKTRRNKSNFNEDVPTKVRVTEERKPVRVPIKDKNAMLTYEDLGITPIQEFDYAHYDKVHAD
jgi:hypothetical protein